MNDRTFFDTNVLAYTLDGADPRKAQIVLSVLRNAVRAHNAVLSYQVLQELFTLAFQKFKPAMTEPEARKYLEDVAVEFEIVPWTKDLTLRAITLKNRFLFSWYDSLIVAAALEARCALLYTEDLQHGQRIEGLQIVNPFR